MFTCGAGCPVVAARITGGLPGTFCEAVALDGEVEEDDGHLFASLQGDVELENFLGFPQRVFGIIRRRVIPCEIKLIFWLPKSRQNIPRMSNAPRFYIKEDGELQVKAIVLTLIQHKLLIIVVIISVTYNAFLIR